MKRIAGVSAEQAGPLLKLAYFFTRRSARQLTGRAPERMLDPLEVYALRPGLLVGIAGLETATATLHRLDDRLKNLAELKPAAPMPRARLKRPRMFSSAITWVSSTIWASSRCWGSAAKSSSGTSTGVRLMATA